MKEAPLLSAGLSLLVVVGAIVSWSLRSEAGAENLLVNAGFEQGTQGWEEFAGSFEIDTDIKHEGEQSLRFSTTAPDSSRAQLNQSGPAAPGDWEASVYVASGSAESGSALLTLRFFAGDIALSETTKSEPLPLSAFRELRVVVTAPPGAMTFTLSLQLEGGSGVSANFDAASVTFEPAPTPTPSETPTPPETPTPEPEPSPTTTPDGSGESSDSADSELAPSSSLRNGNFETNEDGLARHWKSSGGSVLFSEDLARSGFAAGRVQGNLSTPVEITQTVSLLTTGPREFSIHALGRESDATIHLGIQWLVLASQPVGAAVAGEVVQLDGLGYQRVALVSEPPPRAAGAVLTIVVSNGASGSGVFLDDASWRLSRTSSPGRSGAADSGSSNGGVGGPREPPEDLAALAASSFEVLISEIFYYPEGEDVEWVELVNAGGSPVVLSGWSLSDNHGSLELGANVLAPGGYLLVLGGNRLPRGARTAYLSPEGEIGNGLANDGDRVVLVDPAGGLVDAVSYGDDTSALNPAIGGVGPGMSLARRAGESDSGAASDFVSSVPTPGRGLRPLPAAGELQPGETLPIGESEPNVEDQASENDLVPGQEEDGGVDGWLLSGGIVLGCITLGAVGTWLQREELRLRWRRWRAR